MMQPEFNDPKFMQGCRTLDETPQAEMRDRCDELSDKVLAAVKDADMPIGLAVTTIIATASALIQQNEGKSLRVVILDRLNDTFARDMRDALKLYREHKTRESN